MVSPYTPRQFFAEFVKAARDDWKREPASRLRAVNALAQIDAMADRVVNFLRSMKNARAPVDAEEYRLELRARFPALALALEAFATHKRGPTGIRAGVRLISRQHEPRAAGDGSVLSLVDEAKQAHDIGRVLDDSVTSWEAELRSYGI